MDKAILALADGTVFEGEAIGAAGDCIGEIVFNTSMTGYQEILTDPSYKGQIVTMTYPLIGNYGVNKEDVESSKTFLEGFIVKELCAYPQNWRSEENLNTYLKRSGVVGIQGIDTRALTRHIRDNGAQQGIISTVTADKKALVNRAKSSPGLMGRNLVKEVACKKTYKWDENLWQFESGYENKGKNHTKFNVVVYDLGVKYNILRSLVHAGCNVTVCPPTTSPEEVLSLKPDGIFLSNGPGDPEGVPQA
ncbi:MAG: carbamoyl phosphate synthase small subunit, partial [Thermodesulfobacteriota bacterium]